MIQFNHYILGDHCERFGNLGGILLLIDLLKDPSELTVTVHQTNHIIAVLIRCANVSGVFIFCTLYSFMLGYTIREHCLVDNILYVISQDY